MGFLLEILAIIIVVPFIEMINKAEYLTIKEQKIIPTYIKVIACAFITMIIAQKLSPSGKKKNSPRTSKITKGRSK